MRVSGAWLAVSVSMGVAAGCSSAHEGVLDDAGPIVGDAGPGTDSGGGEACGPTTCGAGTVCCNASCGICTPPGTGCIDLACADAGPPQHVCGGLAGIPCGANEYCDYPDGSYCGGDDSQGICRPRPTDCPDPGGAIYCGCDGHDYIGDCSAYFVGVDVAHVGSCSTPPPTMQSVSATRSCGPADGPAWTFVIADGAPVCSGISGGASLTITVWQSLDGVAAGTVLTIGSDPMSQGQASECPAGGGGPPCFVLDGTITFDSFTADASASFSYDLTSFDGTRYGGSHLAVTAWCPSTPLCG